MAAAERRDQPHVLDRHGVALLRHDRADLHEAVGHVQVAGLETGPLVEVLHEAADVDEHHLHRRIDAGDVVARRDAAVAVLLHAREAEQRRNARALDREAGGGDCRGTHAAEPERATGGDEAVVIAQQHLDQRRDVMPEGRRLRRLAVRVGDDQGRLLALGDLEQGSDQVVQPREQRREVLGERHLEQRMIDVVARARGVKLAADLGADFGLERRLDHEEQVLVLAGVAELRGVEVALDRAQRGEDLVHLRPRHDALLRKHDPVRVVDAEQRRRMVVLRGLEQGREHRVAIDRGGEAVEIVHV
jgi:hypothetical protein